MLIFLLIFSIKNLTAQTGCITDATVKLNYSIGGAGGPPSWGNFDCPIEVCIMQHLQCKDGSNGMAWNSCSTINPPPSNNNPPYSTNPITFKVENCITEGCTLVTDRITFKRVTTSCESNETIILTGSDALKFINIISTGSGSMSIGMFAFDCDCEENGEIFTLEGLNFHGH